MTVLNNIEWESLSYHSMSYSYPYIPGLYGEVICDTLPGRMGAPPTFLCLCVCVCECVCVCLSENMLLWAYVFVYLNFSQDPTLRVTLTVYCFIKINFIQIHKQMFLKIQIRISFSVIHSQFL